jgi:hypothetical protein
LCGFEQSLTLPASDCFPTLVATGPASVRRAHSGRIAELNRIRSPSLDAPRSRIFARATSTGPTPVWIVRACRTTLACPSASFKSFTVGLDFDLDRLCQKLPRTRAQHIGQWIIDLVGLTKRDNVASFVHGVSLSSRGSGRLDTRLDTPPISFRHHPLSRIARLEQPVG